MDFSIDLIHELLQVGGELVGGRPLYAVHQIQGEIHHPRAEQELNQGYRNA